MFTDYLASPAFSLELCEEHRTKLAAHTVLCFVGLNSCFGGGNKAAPQAEMCAWMTVPLVPFLSVKKLLRASASVWQFSSLLRLFQSICPFVHSPFLVLPFLE